MNDIKQIFQQLILHILCGLKFKKSFIVNNSPVICNESFNCK